MLWGFFFFFKLVPLDAVDGVPGPTKGSFLRFLNLNITLHYDGQCFLLCRKREGTWNLKHSNKRSSCLLIALMYSTMQLSSSSPSAMPLLYFYLYFCFKWAVHIVSELNDVSPHISSHTVCVGYLWGVSQQQLHLNANRL